MDDRERTQLFVHAIGLLTPRISNVPVRDYPLTTAGLQDYFDDCYGDGPSNFPAAEMVCQHRPSFVKNKQQVLLPPQKWWPRLLLLRWAADQCRLNDPVVVAWVWRPGAINKAAGGANNSAHLTCCAIDLDFPSLMARDMALHNFIHPLWRSPIDLGMGLGVGARRVHIDFFSEAWEEKGHRRRWWRYPTDTNYQGPGTK